MLIKIKNSNLNINIFSIFILIKIDFWQGAAKYKLSYPENFKYVLQQHLAKEKFKVDYSFSLNSQMPKFGGRTKIVLQLQTFH